MQTFGWNFLQFARSVDNLNQEIIDDIKELAGAYFLDKNGLNACYFCVHRPGANFEGMAAFKTVWSSIDSSEAPVVRRYKEKKKDESDDQQPSLRALAYNEDRCLWITADYDAVGNKPEKDATLDDPCAILGDEPEKGATLDDPCANLKDHWRQHKSQDEDKLPPYIHLHDMPCRTLVALPLKHLEQKLGILVIEFDRQIPITKGARREAKLLQKALGRILWLQDAAVAQRGGTRKAFEELKNVISDSASPIDLPKMFFAHSKNSDETVVKTIENLVKENYGNQLVLSPWTQMAEPGQITDQIVSEISSCQYGICYLSERVENTAERAENTAGDTTQQKYVDNSNVLIEAGMMNALRNNRFAQTVAWIPVRENDELTEPMPFDFVAQRMIRVHRDKNGKLMEEDFKEELKKRIEAMIKD